MRGLSWSCWGEQHTIRMAGPVVAHRNTAELPTVTMAVAHYVETALLHAKYPIKAGVLRQLVIHLPCSPHKY